MRFSEASEFAMHSAQNKRKVPLTCRKHVNHVVEVQWIIVPILEKSWVNYYRNVNFERLLLNCLSLAAKNF